MRPLARAAHAGGSLTVDLVGMTSVDAHQTVTIPWHDCLAATWEPPLLTVTTHVAGESRRYGWHLAEPGTVPDAVRDRVTSVLVADVRRDYGDHGTVRFVARRRPEGIEWLTLADDSDWVASELGARSTARDLEELRATLGV